MKKPKWKTIASFSLPYEAQIAKSFLESEGIATMITDEHTINMDWFYSNALGGVRLNVLSGDADRASELLAKDYSQDVDELSE